jgi:predicted nucleic acid-binding protein
MLDTSVWVRVLEGDEATARDLAATQGVLSTATSPIVLAELASILARGRLQVDRPLEAVLGACVVEDLTPEDALAAGKLHGSLRAAGHEKVGLGDCLIYATAQRVGALLVTCDADLAAQKGVALLGAPRAPRRRAT